jgi:hypothetical protein
MEVSLKNTRTGQSHQKGRLGRGENWENSPYTHSKRGISDQDEAHVLFSDTILFHSLTVWRGVLCSGRTHPISVHCVGIRLNICHFPTHASGFLGQDTSVI